MQRRRRLWAFVAIVLLSIAGGVGYVGLALSKQSEEPVLSIAEPSAVASVLSEASLLFLQSDGAAYRPLSLTSLRPGSEVLTLDLICQRVYLAVGRGLCLGEGANAFSGGVAIFDSSFHVVNRLELGGIPSRARVSPDGRYGAVTVFVSGHSYAEAGFSTRTAIIDMATGAFVIDNLEELAVTRDGERFDAIDFNFWGVTFAEDSNRFYATLGTGDKTYLVEGDLATGEARVLKENVECPSLSPDGTRIVFKKRFTHGLLQQVEWRLYLLDLETMQERPLAETRSVDDQVEWVDDSHIIYYLRDEGPPATLRPDLWVVSVYGQEPPYRRLTRAFSPVVLVPSGH